MSSSHGKSVISNTDNPGTTSISTSINMRPLKIQKLQLPTSSQFEFGYNPNYISEEGPSGASQYNNQEQPEPAQNHNDHNQDSNFTEENTTDPFCYYQESYVQESINQCKHSIIGKILADKPISTQVLFNSLSGIWCNPIGLKITELEGKILQIRMDKEEDMQRILKGNPWIFRNCWLLLHS
ncbi:DUF4283 domain protein [Medicago truncatula]|uniref:DUF4283 domain protein n=1 Tax=Medicago truncatula TaxID=3880 RepID=G7J9V0_MEDTR|nr:DUF4283 domain protein [Medicago truncatula]